mgnify:CR=1 FL=1
MGQFALDLRRFAVKTEREMQMVSRKVALDLFHRFVMGTPVDSGRARGNWQCSVGSPAAGTVDREDQSGEMVMAEVTRVVSSWDIEQVSIFLTNNVAYIEALEDGHSGQAPHGWVKITLREYPGIVEKNVRGMA